MRLENTRSQFHTTLFGRGLADERKDSPAQVGGRIKKDNIFIESWGASVRTETGSTATGL